MTTCWSKLARVVDDFNQIAFTQRSHLVASESCECERLTIRADCGHTNGKRSIVTRPFETSHTAADGGVSRRRKTIQEPARENDRFVAVSDVAELRTLELAVVSRDHDEAGALKRICFGFRECRNEREIHCAGVSVARQFDIENETLS